MAVILVLRTDGASAIGFSFIGAPALGLALTIYGVSRWRAGVFRSNATRTRAETGGIGRPAASAAAWTTGMRGAKAAGEAADE